MNEVKKIDIHIVSENRECILKDFDINDIQQRQQYWITHNKVQAFPPSQRGTFGPFYPPDHIIEFSSDAQLANVRAASTLGMTPNIEPCQFALIAKSEDGAESYRTFGKGYISEVFPSRGRHTYRIALSQKQITVITQDGGNVV